MSNNNNTLEGRGDRLQGFRWPFPAVSKPAGVSDARRRPTQDALAMEARAYIEQRYMDAEGCGTTAVAEALGVTASHLCHAYRQTFRVTLGNDLRRLRIRLARQLLADPTRSIKEVAAEVGYARATYRAFFNAFRAESGMSPSAYRRHLRKQQRVAA